jgi:hypothetical protein
MLAFLSNLWAIGKRVPTVLAVIRVITDIIGSAQVQALLESIKDAVVREKEVVGPPKTEKKKVRLWDRIRRRQALDTLGMTEASYDAYCKANNISNEFVA